MYVASTSDVKRIFLRAVEVPIRKIGQQSKEFLSVIETCAGGSDAARPLIMKFLGIVTEKSKKFFQKLILLWSNFFPSLSATPSQELIEKVRILHSSKSDDVRVLIPILNSLTKKEVLAAVPKILKLSPAIVKDVFLRLMGVGLDSKVQDILPGKTHF